MLLFIIPISGQDYEILPAPSGTGDQKIQQLIQDADTSILVMYGDGIYTWDSVEYSYPQNATLIFTTTMEKKYPLKSMLFSSPVDKVEITHFVPYENSFLILGSYVNELKVDGQVLVRNTRASDGIFIMLTDRDFNLLDFTHYEGGLVALPETIHITEGRLVLPISLHGKLYFKGDVIHSGQDESLLFLWHTLDNLAYANVDSFPSIDNFHIGDYGWKGDTLYIAGQFRDSIITRDDSLYNGGHFPDPVILLYTIQEGMINGISFQGSYGGMANRLLIAGDTVIIAGNFIGGLVPEVGEIISIGEEPGIYAFVYIAGEYRGAQVLSSRAFISLSSAHYLGGRLFMTMSFVKEVRYGDKELQDATMESAYALLELADFQERGKLELIPYRGTGNFPFVFLRDGKLEIFGTINGYNIRTEEQSDGMDVIHLRELNRTASTWASPYSGEVRLYPQPASDYVKVEGLQRGTRIYYAVYGMDGRLVRRGEYRGQISLNALQSQVYMIVLYTEKGRRLASRPCIILH